MLEVGFLEGDKLRQVVVVLKAPELKVDNLTYTVKVLQGEMPAKGADVSVLVHGLMAQGRQSNLHNLPTL